MIKLRLNPLDSHEETIALDREQTLLEAVEYSLEKHNIDKKYLSNFHVLQDGKIVDPESYELLIVNDNSDILISPNIEGGDFGQLFKQVAIIAITIAANVAAPGLGFGVVGTALFTAGVSIGATLLLNSLIPPPNPGGLGLGGAGDGVEASQMYSLGGQSNKAKPFQVVPRVYGTFLVYPNVAAQPYTQIEVDFSTGKLVQVLYVIYDFGLGPIEVSEIKIGTTAIENFSDVTYNLVDLNKPDVDEGSWDTQLIKNFQFYKGDVSLSEDPTGLNLNKTGSNDVGLELGDYQVIRNGPVENAGRSQEMIVTVVFPRGLFSFNNQGTRGNGTVELELEFALQGTNDWKPYNDFDFISNFKSTGGANKVANPIIRDLIPFGLSEPYYPQIGDSWQTTRYDTISTGPSRVDTTVFPRNLVHVQYGIPKGGTEIRVTTAPSVNDSLEIDGNYLGNVVSVTDMGSYFSVILDQPLFKDVPLFTYVRVFSGSFLLESFFENFNTNRVSTGTVVAKKAFVTASEQGQYFAQFNFTPRTPGNYKIRLTRIRTDYQFSSQKISDMTYVSLTTRYDSLPIITLKRHTFLELRIRATNQINGTVDTLNAIVKSVVPIYDNISETWGLGFSSNPAWIFADIMTGPINKRPVSLSRLDTDSLVEWAEYADEIPTTPPTYVNDTFTFPRFSSNFIVDFNTTVKNLIDNIGGATQASLNIVDGKYGVLVDRLKDTPVQIFTPRNYSQFSSNRTYSPPSQGIRVKYNDPFENWRLQEAFVYADGFDGSNVTEELEELRSFGITNSEQAWRFGRYMLAQAALRQETIAITVDFENLVCTRGDYVKFTQDAMRVGGRPARVKTVVGTTITIDDAIDTVAMNDYGYTFRGVGGVITSTLTPVNSTTFELDGAIPEVGDLIVIGVVDQITFDCIVKSITPQNDLSAQLILVEKKDAIFTSLETGVIPSYNPQIGVSSSVSIDPPGEVENLQVIENSFTAGEGKFDYFIELGWEAPLTGGVVDSYEIYVNRETGYVFWDTVKELDYVFEVDPFYLGTPHDFKILAVSSGGEKLGLGQVGFVTATPERKVTPPADVVSLNINITNQVIQLDWDLLDEEEGIANYVVRYNPTNEGTWFTASNLAIVDAQTSSTSAQGRTGTYLIKAVDFEGNESANATLAITSIPSLFDLNIIANINDKDLGWPGTKDRVVESGGSLFLDKVNATDYFNEGYYYYESILELGEIYTTRFQNLVSSGGYTEQDLMVDWDPLSDVLALTSALTSSWNVEAQVRVNDQINFISTWVPLSDVVNMAEGDIDNWTPYKSFINGDFTGRLYQFRLKLTSNQNNVTPEVFDGRIKADMPDRIVSGNDIVSDIGGTAIVYDPPFTGPSPSPSIQISQDTAQQGDYYVLTLKSLDGFTITFYDNTDTAVSRQFDYYAKGYGRKALEYI